MMGHHYLPNAQLFLRFFWQRILAWMVLVQRKKEKNKNLNEIFLGASRDCLFSYYHRLIHCTFSISLILHAHVFGAMCVCAGVRACMLRLCHDKTVAFFIQFTCVWTLNIHLDGLSVILFFYYISDNNAILKIFSNSVLLGAHTYTRTLQIDISCVFFSQIIESKIGYEVNSTCILESVKN